MSEALLIQIRVPADTSKEARESLSGAIGPESWFVTTRESPELGRQVKLEFFVGDDGHALLQADGIVGWRYPRDKTPPGRVPGFGAWVDWKSCSVLKPWGQALQSAPDASFAPPGSRLTPAGMVSLKPQPLRFLSTPEKSNARSIDHHAPAPTRPGKETEGRPSPGTPAPAQPPRPLPAAWLGHANGNTPGGAVPVLVGHAYVVRPGRSGVKVVRRQDFGWPASGTTRPTVPFDFDDDDDTTGERRSLGPLPPELEMQPWDDEAAGFVDEITDPGRLSAFVSAAVRDTQRGSEVDEGDTVPLSQESVTTPDLLRVSEIRNSAAPQEAAPQEEFETQEDFETLFVQEDNSGDGRHASDAELDLTAARPKEASKRDRETRVAVTSTKIELAHREEDPAATFALRDASRPPLTFDLSVSLPGQGPASELAFAAGTLLPAAIRREVGTGGDSHLEVELYAGPGSGSGSEPRLLGVARFETNETGVVFDLEIRVEVGEVVIEPSLPELQPQRFAFPDEELKIERPAAEEAAAEEAAAEKPGGRNLAPSPALPPPLPEDEDAPIGLVGRLKKLIGN